MAVLQTSMEEKESKKHSLQSKKSKLLLVQDIKYSKKLAANDEKVRKKALKFLDKYLEERSKTSPLTEESLKVLWKGLFYLMWLSDKSLVQEKCAEDISNIIHCLEFEQAMQFFKIGLVTLQNEWAGIDQLRLDKFLMFVRRLLRQALFVLKKANFRKQPNEIFANILEQTILSTTNSVPLGLLMHFTEIYLEELAKVSDGKIQSSRTLDFLKPFINKLAFSDEQRIIKWIVKFIFTHLTKQHKLGLEYEEKYKIWRQHGFVGSINQIQKVTVPVTTDSEDSEENESSPSTANKPLDPRAGRVDVELPQIPFNAKEISEALLVPRNEPGTTKNSRHHLTIWSENFLKLHNGVYPLGPKKLETRKRKNVKDVDTNIRRAAKRLIKFENKLMTIENRGNKRKRENSEDREELDVPNMKKKKKIALPIENSSKSESSNEVKVKKDKLKKLKAPKTELGSDFKKISNKKKLLEAKKTEKAAKLKNSLKNKKLRTNDTTSSADSSIDEYNFCFKRNSGIWYVTPEFSEKNSRINAAESKNSEIEAEANNREYDIFVPSKNFLKKLKKTKSDEGVEHVLSRLRGKSRTSLNKLSFNQPINVSTPKETKTTSGSPKKVKINTKLNVSQDIDDHILQVKSSPQIPWDSNKKPGKPLLKTPVKASPINPFYKLRRF